MRYVLMIAFFCLLLSQEPTPGPGNQPSSAATHPKKKAAPQQNPATKAPATRNADTAFSADEHSGDPAAKDKGDSTVNIRAVPALSVKPDKDSADYALIIATVLLVAVGGGQLYFLRESIGVAAQSARAAAKSANALMSGERAWVLGIVTGHPEFEEPEVLSIYCLRPIFQNYGKTPARITRIVGKRHPLARAEKLPDVPNYEGDISQIIGDIMLPPGIPIQPFQICMAREEFQPTTIDLFIYGFVDYLDVFEQPHVSRFCYAYHVPRGFNADPPGFYVSGPSEYNRCT